MPVAVVNVRKVRVLVRHYRMVMRMGMGLRALPGKVVRMLVMRVMHMAVCVRKRFMRVFVFVVFGQVQPDAQRHESARQPECR